MVAVPLSSPVSDTAPLSIFAGDATDDGADERESISPIDSERDVSDDRTELEQPAANISEPAGGGGAAEEAPQAAAPPVASPEAAPVEPPKPEQSPEQKAAAAKLAAEMNHQRRLEEAEQEYLEAALKVADLEEEISDAKERLKEAKELAQACAVRLRSIRNNDPQQLDFLDKADEIVAASKGSETTTDEPNKPTASSERTGGGSAESKHSSDQPPASDDFWKREPLRNIIAGVKGCGEKKLDAICDKFPTLGDFVDLQAKAGGYGIHEEMPDGVGKKLCESLEQCVLDWLSANRDKFNEPIDDPTKPAPFAFHDFTPAPQEALPAQGISMEAAVPEGSGTSIEADELQASGDDASNPSPQVTPVAAKDGDKSDSGDLHAAQIKSRLEVLRSRPESERKPWNGDIWAAGRDAARNDWEARDCVWIAGSEQDDWLLGWLSVRG